MHMLSRLSALAALGLVAALVVEAGAEPNEKAPAAEVRRFDGFKAAVTVVKFSPDGRTAVIGAIFLPETRGASDFSTLRRSPQGAEVP